MEEKLLKSLDNLDFEEASLLLKDESFFPIDEKTKVNIMNITKEKIKCSKNSNNIVKNSHFLNMYFKKNVFFILILCVVTICLGGIISYPNKAAAYISLDVDASLEIGINKYNRVISYKPYNNDGNIILDKNKTLNVDIVKAVDDLITSSIDNNYIKDDDSSVIHIACITDQAELANKINDSLLYEINSLLKKRDIHAEVIFCNIPLETRNLAEDLGINPGKLFLINELQKLDPSIDVDDYKNESIKDIQRYAIELKNKTILLKEDSENEKKQTETSKVPYEEKDDLNKEDNPNKNINNDKEYKNNAVKENKNNNENKDINNQNNINYSDNNNRNHESNSGNNDKSDNENNQIDYDNNINTNNNVDNKENNINKENNNKENGNDKENHNEHNNDFDEKKDNVHLDNTDDDHDHGHDKSKDKDYDHNCNKYYWYYWYEEHTWYYRNCYKD